MIEPTPAVTQDAIRATSQRIRDRIRRTPVLELDGAELGLGAYPVSLKLESLQHSGSFKARGAFASLTTGAMPDAGVAAASGGNHGAAVAFAAQSLGIPARIFVPTISSPAKVERIRGYGAIPVVEGERYADALALCEAWCADTGARSIHAYDQVATLLGQGTTGARARGAGTQPRHSPGRRRRRRAHRRHCGLVSWPHPHRRRRARRRTLACDGTDRRPPRRRSPRQHRRRFARTKSGRCTHVPVQPRLMSSGWCS